MFEDLAVNIYLNINSLAFVLSTTILLFSTNDNISYDDMSFTVIILNASVDVALLFYTLKGHFPPAKNRFGFNLPPMG